MTIDTRTNSLFITDTEQSLTSLRSLIKKMDIAVPQILITARIVNLDDDYEQELGTRLGVNGKHFNASIALPANASNAGQLSLALLPTNHSAKLDLELSALEKDGHAEILSSPHLFTADRQTASIEAGEEIPYQEAVSQGVTTTAFKKAVLKLEVTPHVTPNNKIVLQLTVNQDKRSSQEILGVPAIDTRRISTQILLNDNQTLILGGIYEHTATNHIERIPFVSDLPVIGVLFQHKKTVDNRRELLIFVTPTIIKI